MGLQPGLVLTGQRLEVRLVNGSDRCSGTVEVKAGGSWELPCGVLWDHSASEAACRALGCGGAKWGPDQPTPLPLDHALGNASGTPNTTWALAPIVLCSSSEWQLCMVEQHLCDPHGQPAQVTCAGTAMRGPDRLPQPLPQPWALGPSCPPNIQPHPPPSQTQLLPTPKDTAWSHFQL